MKIRIAIQAALLLTFVGSTAFAGSENKTGTAGAPELAIPIGTRGVALGGSVIASPSGLESIYWNPAGLASLDATSTTFCHQPYLADMSMDFFGIATNIEGFGSLGGSVRVLSVGDIEETTEAQPEGTGRIYNPTLSVVSITYATNLTTAVAFGLNASFIHESVFEASASGMGFDFGVTYEPQWKGWTMGLAIKNIGPKMTYSGAGFDRRFESGGQRTFTPKAAPFELPSSIKIGLANKFMNRDMHTATFTSTFVANQFSPDAWHGGVEYGYNERYYLRGGYVVSTGSGESEDLYGASLGIGLNIPVGHSILEFGYAWSETKVFDDNQFISLGLSF